MSEFEKNDSNQWYLKQQVDAPSSEVCLKITFEELDIIIDDVANRAYQLEVWWPAGDTADRKNVRHELLKRLNQQHMEIANANKESSTKETSK